MKKIIGFICVLLLSSSLFAGTVMVPYQDTGIITPNIATNLYRTQTFAISGDGELLICPRHADFSWGDTTCLYMKKNAYILANKIVPASKTYVGFNITNGTLTIYWK